MKISIPHKWRKLPKNQRLNIPNEIFNIDKEIINKIRKIEDPKKRLIKSAKIQYELFNDIHNDLTAWMSGYLSEVIIRQKFGSARKLRENIVKKDDKINNWMDIKRGIRLPDEINEIVAEEVGIHIGDGNLYKKYTKNQGYKYRFAINGNLIDDYLYHTIHITKILKQVYNYSGNIAIQKNKNSIANIINSKEIVEFKNKILGLPIGNKKLIEIPKEIFNNKNLAKRCIVGIIDTDFNLSKNISLIGKMHSLKLMKQLDILLETLNISHSIKENIDHTIIRINKEDSIKIIENWQINNEKHLSKYKIWNEFKTYIPFTTTPERMLLLKGEISIEDLRKISENRKNTPQAGFSLFKLEPATL